MTTFWKASGNSPDLRTENDRHATTRDALLPGLMSGDRALIVPSPSAQLLSWSHYDKLLVMYGILKSGAELQGGRFPGGNLEEGDLFPVTWPKPGDQRLAESGPEQRNHKDFSATGTRSRR